ncbi:MAG TPA: hypothetical protein VMB47_01025 [Candidatus Aquilonibacter sp.]|nr:hypothetical protein [Candidatus Aquilonibacter sp.]
MEPLRRPRQSTRARQSVIPLLIALAFVIAAILYLARESHSPPPSTPPPGSQNGRVGPMDIYPIESLTPGAINLGVTQANIEETICNPHWSTRSERPPEEYTYRLKREQMVEYHLADAETRDYEEDHLIPLELGGSPTDPKNLWPEAYSTSIPDGGAKYKDKVENYLHDQVCAGGMSLADAQQRIATDWYRVYVSSVR